MVGSFAVPFALLIFFWETNAPRNISIYEISKMFFIGGAASLVITLFLYSFFPVNDLNYIGAIVVGIVEEAGKLIIIAYFVKRLDTKYILNGLLIGAAIGAGFALFESAGYAFNFGLITNGSDAMLAVIMNRAWTAIGTHVVWSAITGAALVFVKGANPLVSDHFTNSKFLQLFAVSVILHAVWDMPLYMLKELNLLYFVLIFVTWTFIFTLMNSGLKQIMRINMSVHSPQDLTRD
jgi:RsiW-degrading membrane proteinase PrsW (M82 family)